MKRLIIIGLLSLTGCATQQWISQPDKASLENEYITAEVVPTCVSDNIYAAGCRAFRLSVTNKSQNNIEVNWNKTLYIANNQTSGGFMFEGVVYRDRNNPKSPDVVFPNSTLTKTIWPNNLVNFQTGQYGGWKHERMPAGDVGVYLSTNVNGKEINERLMVHLISSQK